MVLETDSLWRWIAEIQVPMQGGTWVCTGYPITPKRVLTVRHAMHPPGEKAAGETTVRLVHQDGEAGAPRRVLSEMWADESTDVAILDVEELAIPSHCCGMVSFEAVRDGVAWKVMGLAGVEADPGVATGLSGTIQPSADGALVLGVDYEVEESEDYSGISGAPVFVQGRIVGVVTTRKPRFKGRRIAGSAIAAFLEDAAFRAAVGIPRVDTLEAVVENAYGALAGEGNRPVVRRLRKALRLEEREAWNREAVRECLHGLLPLRMQGILELLNRIQLDIFESPDASVPRLRSVERFAQAVGPAALDDAVLSIIRERGVVADLVTTRAVGEIHMAGASGRMILFQPVVLDDDMLDPDLPFPPPGKAIPEPRPKLALPLPAELGMKLDAWMDEIHRDFASLLLNSTPENPATCIALVHDRLESLASRHKQQFYVLFDSQSGFDFDYVSQQLRKEYPALRILSLGQDEELARQERGIIDLLNEMTYRTRHKERYG